MIRTLVSSGDVGVGSIGLAGRDPDVGVEVLLLPEGHLTPTHQGRPGYTFGSRLDERSEGYLWVETAMDGRSQPANMPIYSEEDGYSYLVPRTGTIIHNVCAFSRDQRGKMVVGWLLEL